VRINQFLRESWGICDEFISGQRSTLIQWPLEGQLSGTSGKWLWRNGEVNLLNQSREGDRCRARRSSATGFCEVRRRAENNKLYEIFHTNRIGRIEQSILKIRTVCASDGSLDRDMDANVWRLWKHSGTLSIMAVFPV
jgi:hypothetical protein